WSHATAEDSLCHGVQRQRGAGVLAQPDGNTQLRWITCPPPVHPAHVQRTHNPGPWPSGAPVAFSLLRTVSLGHELWGSQLQLAAGEGAKTVRRGTLLPCFLHLFQVS